MPSLLLPLILVILTTCSPENTKVKYESAIKESNRILDSLRVAQKIPGIDAAVSINNKIVWSQAFGFADLEHQVPVTAGVTRFRIGSVSKSLTVAALGKLVEAGKIKMEEVVQTYAPDFPTKKYPVTIMQLGGHIAGIRHYRGNEFLLNEHFENVKSGLSIFENDTLLFEPGANYSYSTYGFNLLSAIIEGVSRESFLTFIQREVFTTLNMSSTCADKNDSIISNRTSFYQTDSKGNVVNAPCVDNSYKWAGGGFISTTSDLLKFGEAHINPGFLSAQTLRDFTRSQVLSNGDSTGYGVGWRSFRKDGLSGFGHTGGSVGGITDLRIYPKENLVLVFLSNSSDTEYGTIGDRIVALFLAEGK